MGRTGFGLHNAVRPLSYPIIISMSQLKYDITEFVLNNRDEILHFLNEEMDHLKFAERLFDSCPELYDELIQGYRKRELTHFLADHFNEPFDSISLIIDDEFIKMTLQYY